MALDDQGGDVSSPRDYLEELFRLPIDKSVGVGKGWSSAKRIQPFDFELNQRGEFCVEAVPGFFNQLLFGLDVGTTRLAASVGVEARRSATSSRIGRSAS